MKTLFSSSTFQLYGIWLLIFLLLFFVFNLQTFAQLNNIITDQLHGQIRLREEIVIVGIDDSSLNEIGSWPWNREIFADLTENILNSNPAVIAFDLLFLEERDGDAEFEEVLNNAENNIIVLGQKLEDTVFIKDIYNIETVRSGYVNFFAESDGKVRSSNPFVIQENICEQSFSLAVLNSYLKNHDNVNCENPLTIRSNTYNLSETNSLKFRYTRDDFPVVNVVDILAGNFEDSDFENKIVLVGSTIIDLRGDLPDVFTDIFGNTTPGVTIHANVINTYLENAFINPIPTSLTFVVIAVASFSLLFILQKLKRNILDFIAFASFLIVGNTIGVFLFEFDYIWDFVQYSLVILAVYVYSIVFKFVLEKQEKQFISNAFGKYLNKNLLETLLAQPDRLKLGGERKYMTVLFSDIRGFTSISEKLNSEELVQMINDYLDYMSNIIINNGGTIDKFIGDAIMALWNAPLPDEQHEEHAVIAALKMIKQSNKFNEKHPNYPDITIGVGVNSGNMVVGNVGGKGRFDYTVLGDNVNLGSRVESLTKYYGAPVLITENTAKKITSKSVGIRQVDVVIVKGKSDPIELYEPFFVESKNKDDVILFEKAYTLYEKGEFNNSINILQKLKNDTVAQSMIFRIQEMRKDEKDNWKGVYKWDKK